MRLLAINGSPRKNKNTGRLLKNVVEGAKSRGAETELVHLRDFAFTGCKSCFSCKKEGTPFYGRCAMQDELTPILQKAHDADILVLGSPFYLSAETSLMRAFLERLFFQYIQKMQSSVAPRKKRTALVYTMNIAESDMSHHHQHIIDMARIFMERLFAPCELLFACDTALFDDHLPQDENMPEITVGSQDFTDVLVSAYNMGVYLTAASN